MKINILPNHDFGAMMPRATGLKVQAQGMIFSGPFEMTKDDAGVVTLDFGGEKKKEKVTKAKSKGLLRK